MVRRIAKGDQFKSPFTGKIFEVKKVVMDSVLLEEVGNEDRKIITETGTIISLYEKPGVRKN